ncbi:MAG TPA: hypothetical protein VMB19_08595 [Silvibacterium sp.]|nr:hypothetical protein [Silvibacterium sp.]
MKFTRRDLFVWGAGAAAGMVFTPVPWKLLDDVSIWTQNWPWIPQSAGGTVEIKQSFCSLCPNGCGLKVRTAAGWPVGVAGMATHPITRGALCPLGLGAHQLNWHPRRLKSVLHRGNSSSWNEARSAIARACGEGPVVIVDGYPGRAASSLFETFAKRQKGSYRVAICPETQALTPYERWTGVSALSLGYDLENAGTIVSFGAPLLDGWGPPGRFTRLWADRSAGQTNPQLRLIQVDEVLSRTAARASQWVPVRAGSESVLAAELARTLLEEHLVPARGPLPLISPQEACDRTGLTADAIRGLAQTVVAGRPAVAIANGDDPSVAALNVLLGAVGARGGIIRTSRSARQYVSADVLPSARAVLIDATVPWDFVPQTDAEVFRFSAWNAGFTKADWLLPAPGFLEELTDVPTPPTSVLETYGVAVQLSHPPSEVQSAAQFLASCDSSLPTVEAAICARCEVLFRGCRGTLYSESATPISKIESAQKLEEALWKGAVWVGDPPDAELLRCDVKEWPTPSAGVSNENWSAGWRAPVLPPLAAKLYKESTLRDAPDRRNA